MSLRDFCNKKLNPNDSFIIPPMIFFDVGKYITMMDNNKSMGHDNINPFLLKLALPNIVEPLTYIYNLSILNNVFPNILKKRRSKSDSSAQNQ